LVSLGFRVSVKVWGRVRNRLSVRVGVSLEFRDRVSFRVTVSGNNRQPG